MKVEKYLRYFSRIALIIITTLCFLFALFSGAKTFGGGFRGILFNSFNAIPWLFLFAIIYVAWKWEFIGGIIITITGFFSIIFFHTYKSWVTFLGISVLLIIIGISLLLSTYFTKDK